MGGPFSCTGDKSLKALTAKQAADLAEQAARAYRLIYQFLTHGELDGRQRKQLRDQLHRAEDFQRILNRKAKK